ncbi:sce7726 family protein [Streptomyces sp. TRM76323]|uniref:Sce7726 family protein n=1 Tax=Streptomyces tamarix TaxID=3078565 RepID=A0ABU3QKX0_9ACTN|nr:sce7726 family protein [Streptomyces tamarix]MDT9683425.1 sce7726 family protein [Streptomyces tamarix]
MKKIDDEAQLYERAVKTLLLTKPHIFGNLGRSSVVFEKAIASHSVIADALIFSENYGIIGVEIKTDHDSTTRLNRQLSAYKVVCDQVYVLCHDNKLEAVERVLERYKHTSVGIVAYSTYEGEQALGIVKDSYPADEYKPEAILDVLWKSEVRALADVVSSPTKLTIIDMKRKLGESFNRFAMSVPPVFTNRMPKKSLINQIITRIGKYQAHEIATMMFYEHIKDPEKALKYYMFRDDISLNEVLDGKKQ